MGLEGVEIVLGSEETFGIEIPNEVAARILTPAELVEYITSRVTTIPVEQCLTQQLFYRLRRGFKRQVAAFVTRFDLETPLSDILHKDQWHVVWAAIRADVGDADWPVSVPWPGFLKDGPRNVRQLIWHIVESLPRPDGNAHPWTRPLIEAQVRRIIREVTGKQDFPLRASFTKELGVS
jgi:acyl carrier protein